jgi:DNA-directed RNA polymerase subunit RPC12/RpoP/uncharacterized C2H2 Zn-finger protein
VPLGTDQGEVHAHACPYCPTQFDDFNHLKSHLLKHREKQCYRCPSCPTLFEQLDQLLNHLNTAHLCVRLASHSNPSLPAAVASSKALYQCFDCSKWFDTTSQLQTHASAANHRPFACELCDKRFQNKRSLNRHFRLHSNQTFVCDRCPKQFKTAIYLKTHQQTHSRQRSHVCPQCSATFARADQLQRHSLTHDKQKRFCCPFRESDGCTREFQRADKLKQHVTTHLNHESLTCAHCGRTYQNSKTFRLHLMTHSLDKQRLLESFDQVSATKLLPKGIESISELESHSLVSDLQLEVTVGQEEEESGSSSLESTMRLWDCTICAKLFASAAELSQHFCQPTQSIPEVLSRPPSLINSSPPNNIISSIVRDTFEESLSFTDLLLDESQVPSFVITSDAASIAISSSSHSAEQLSSSSTNYLLRNSSFQSLS